MAGPKDLTFRFYRKGFDLDLTFQFWGYGSGKGYDSGVLVRSVERVGREPVPGGYADTQVSIHSQRLGHGLTYKDLKSLERWARTAANALRRESEREGRKVDLHASINDEHKDEES